MFCRQETESSRNCVVGPRWCRGNIYSHEINHLNFGLKRHFEIRRRFENCGAMPMATMKITAKIQHTTCVLTLFSANADVKIPFFFNVKIVQAYNDASFLWKGFEITEPSVCCHLLLLWKWIHQVSWKQVSNKLLLWKCTTKPLLTIAVGGVTLPPQCICLLGTPSCARFFHGEALSFSSRTPADLPLVVGLLCTPPTHTSMWPCPHHPHRDDTWAHPHPNPVCKGQADHQRTGRHTSNVRLESP